MAVTWTARERASDLAEAAERGVDLLIIGGGITGAGVLRDATLRGLSALLVERQDFAGGTSSATSKMIHGGLRYLAEGALAVTRQSCRERDRLAALNPNLVHPLPFLFCSFEDGVAPWQVRAGLALYGALAGWGGRRGRMLKPAEVARYSRDLRHTRVAGLYYDAQVDDARFVLEVLKSARRAGGRAVPYAELTAFERDAAGALCAARVVDRTDGTSYRVAARAFVNAAGPACDRVRDLDTPLEHHDLRPAKGVHIVLPRGRVHADAAVAFQSPRDGRHMFLCPYEDVHLVGTTDEFTDELDAPTVSDSEVDYLLEAANHAFPAVRLSRADVISCWAGVRPLVADASADKPASKVSREHRITVDASGLISVAGGKLTTFRAMAEDIVDRVARRLPGRRLERCTTWDVPLRPDRFDLDGEAERLTAALGVSARHARRVLQAWGADAADWLVSAPAGLRAPIGHSRYLYAEVQWAVRHECALHLHDVLERRLRVAGLCAGQGLETLARVAQVAAEAAGWDGARVEEEVERYRERVRRYYQVAQ